MRSIDLKRQARYVHVDVARAQAIADAWEEVEDNPNDPRTRRAYDALARQTMDQYMALEKAGYKFWFYDGNTDPYKENPWNAMRQLRDEQKMAVFSTKAGYGNKFNDSLAKQSPMLAETGLYWSMGSEDGPKQPVLFNDLFRAVHDAFGHGIEGAGFRGRGEENAWQAHVRLFTGDAIPALTSETRGQNSWLNYGPYGLHNRTAKIQDVIFADQKTGLMPSWTWTEGRVGDMPEEDIKFAAKRKAPRPVGAEIPQTVDRVADADAARVLAKSRVFDTNRELKMELQSAVQQAASAAGVNVSEFSEATERYLVRIALAEARKALKQNANAVGWYKEKVTKALNIASLKHPELRTNPEARFAFIWALAVTSNGIKVDKNFEMADTAYEQWKRDGTFPTDIGQGTAKKNINNGLRAYNLLSKRFSFEELRTAMLTKSPVSQIAKTLGIKPSGEYADTIVYGAAILGPKIGNGFFANLYGNYEQLTIDRWLMRTWGRWTGTLVEVDPLDVQEKTGRLAGLVKMLGARQREQIETIIGRSIDVDDLPGTAEAILRGTTKESSRDLLETVGKLTPVTRARVARILGPEKSNASRVSLGDEIRKAGKNLVGAIDGQVEVPRSPAQRNEMRQVFDQVLTELQKSNSKLNMSDLQALLWYPEKRIYEAAKTDEQTDDGYEDNAAPDYANAAAKHYLRLGVTQAEINRVIAETDAELQAGNSAGSSGRSAGGVAEQPGRAGLKASEKRSDLVSIFKGLQSGRGLALIRAQEMVANHPNGDAITKINDDFYDILGRLEDEGAIRINCK